MEAYSHSHHSSHSISRPQTSSAPTTFSGNKKPPLFNNNNNGGLFTSYDDVYGGPPRFTSSSSSLAPRSDDYSEIFGGFRSSTSSSRAASSIPVLDLPAISDIDSRASFSDYTDVFGGFNSVDFALSYDELFQPLDAVDDSSDEAWTPVGTESLSDDSDPFASSENSQCLLDANSDQPWDSKQFNISYHKVNLGTSTYTPNMTHVAQLNAVSGYTHVVDEATSSIEMRKEKLCSPMVDDIVLNMNSSSIMSQRHISKTMSHVSHDGAGLKSFDADHRSGKAHTTSMSHVNSTSQSVSDINLRTEPSHLRPPSRPPLMSSVKKGDSIILTSGPKTSEKCVLDGTGQTGDCSLPLCFDMEVDASSSTAASAAAMKDAMEKAQAKVKAATELRDRKKDGFQESMEMASKADLPVGENVKIPLDEFSLKDNIVQATCERRPSKTKNRAKGRHATSASQILPDISAVERPTGAAGNLAEQKHEHKGSFSIDIECTAGAGEWKEVTQYYEFVNIDNSKLAPQSTSSFDGKTAALKHQDNDENNSDSAEEACVPGDNRRRLKAMKAVSRQEYHERLVKVAQEVHDRVMCGHAEMDKRVKGMTQGSQKEHNQKLGYESEKNERKLRQAQQAEERRGEPMKKEIAKMGSRDPPNRETKKTEIETCHIEQNGRNANDPHHSKVSGSWEREESERRMEAAVLGEVKEQRVKESCEQQRKEEKLTEPVKQKKEERREVKKSSKEALKDKFGGERLHTASGSQECDQKKDLQQRQLGDNITKEAFEDIFYGERLQNTCQSEEDGKIKDLRQRVGNENQVEVVVNGQGSEKMLNDCVELEYRKCNGILELQKSKQRLDESHKLAADKKKSEEGQKQDENEEKQDFKIEAEKVENKSPLAGRLEEIGKDQQSTGDEEDQMGTDRSIKFEWEDEDQKPFSCPEIKPYTEDEHLKSSDGDNIDEKNVPLDSSKLNKSQVKADGFQEMPAWKLNGQNRSMSIDKNKFKASKTTDLLIDERPMGSNAAQVGSNENEHERTVYTSNTFQVNENITESGVLRSRNGQIMKENRKVAQSVSDTKFMKDINLEEGGKRWNIRESQVFCDNEEVVRSTQTEQTTGWNEHEQREAAHTVMPERKESIDKRFQVPSMHQSTERKEKIVNQNCCIEAKDKERKRDLENEHIRKLEEEREREREREKDRMAVEIAIRKAHERAYVDARDRAALERATDEARQRAMAEARARLEKACAEARERSLTDKASESRLRAERAAVDRATAEARQRAIEKAMAERATLEARKRIQRSVSEKYLSESDVILRHNSLRSNSEKFEAADREPAQRCKARLERHRRTVERVAKALEEKNMRDLIAQREQVERSRLAETLDADIKRWSSGKEGNLRALLSTLQYILGPGSGWQPIPLTEVITAAAVKKAYRKATLCVHPDKLQQRGASVQHKYICEKVFDLLKEAWNRFNSEEK